MDSWEKIEQEMRDLRNRIDSAQGKFDSLIPAELGSWRNRCTIALTALRVLRERDQPFIEAAERYLACREEARSNQETGGAERAMFAAYRKRRKGMKHAD